MNLPPTFVLVLELAVKYFGLFCIFQQYYGPTSLSLSGSYRQEYNLFSNTYRQIGISMRSIINKGQKYNCTIALT